MYRKAANFHRRSMEDDSSGDEDNSLKGRQRATSDSSVRGRIVGGPTNRVVVNPAYRRGQPVLRDLEDDEYDEGYTPSLGSQRQDSDQEDYWPKQRDFHSRGRGGQRRSSEDSWQEQPNLRSGGLVHQRRSSDSSQEQLNRSGGYGQRQSDEVS
jgi:hypothetical protein